MAKEKKKEAKKKKENKTMIKVIANFGRRLFSGMMKKKGEVKLGLYGSPNAGKTSLANKVCQDWLGEDLGSVSKVPHETRDVQFKEKVFIEKDGRKVEFKLIDTPGIATKIDFEDFLKFGMKKKDAQSRAKEATQGIIESIKWLDDVDVVVVVLDSTMNPYSQVNITIIGNLVARDIPVLIVANKIDLKKSDIKKVQGAFPEYEVVGISAKNGDGIEDFYESLFKLIKRSDNMVKGDKTVVKGKGWRAWPAWVKGGVISNLIFLLIALVISLVVPTSVFTTLFLTPGIVILFPILFGFGQLESTLVNVILMGLVILVSVLAYFIIGAIIGLIVGKIKGAKR